MRTSSPRSALVRVRMASKCLSLAPSAAFRCVGPITGRLGSDPGRTSFHQRWLWECESVCEWHQAGRCCRGYPPSLVTMATPLLPARQLEGQGSQQVGRAWSVPIPCPVFSDIQASLFNLSRCLSCIFLSSPHFRSRVNETENQFFCNKFTAQNM